MFRPTLAALLMIAGTSAHAATVDSVTLDKSVAIHDDRHENGDQTIGYVENLFGDEIIVEGAIFNGELPGTTAGLSPVDRVFANLFFGADGRFSTGELSVSADGGSLLSGFGIDAKFGADTVSVLFEIDGGTFAATFGKYAMLTLTGFGFDASSGAMAFEGSTNADFAINPASEIAPVPLPAGLPLLMGGLGLLAVLRRRAR